MEKNFKTIAEQIEILKDKNLIIKDYHKAYELLSKNNYYYLINGYKDLFLDKHTSIETYIDNTKFEELYALYLFDKNIKINFLNYLLLIENEIDTYISYEFSKKFGHKNYLDVNNFNTSKLNITTIQKFIHNINLEIGHQYKNYNKMIVHYLDNYNYISLWVLVRVLSFGKISKFYSLMKPQEQNVISKKYNLKTNEFKTILHNLTLIRNICAHDEKLYDIKLKNRIFSTIYYQNLKIENINGNYQYATRDLFSIVISLKLLLSKQDFEKFYKTLLRDITNLKPFITTIPFDNILNKMGFPKNYKKLLKL